MLLLESELAHHPHRLHFHFAEDLVEEFVGQKLNLVATLNIHLVHVLELSLALVELVQVCHLQSYAGMRLINFDAQRVLDALDRQVLAHRPELLVYVPVISFLLFPFFADELERLPENLFRPDLAGIWC
jgi:hypothetical protein